MSTWGYPRFRRLQVEMLTSHVNMLRCSTGPFKVQWIVQMVLVNIWNLSRLTLQPMEWMDRLVVQLILPSNEDKTNGVKSESQIKHKKSNQQITGTKVGEEPPTTIKEGHQYINAFIPWTFWISDKSKNPLPSIHIPYGTVLDLGFGVIFVTWECPLIRLLLDDEYSG